MAASHQSEISGLDAAAETNQVLTGNTTHLRRQ
jgi:hypothetical protein